MAKYLESPFAPDRFSVKNSLSNWIANLMSDQDQVELRTHLASLEIDHRDLSQAIEALIQAKGDVLCIQRFKKKKLALRDEIEKLHTVVTPDIIA